MLYVEPQDHLFAIVLSGMAAMVTSKIRNEAICDGNVLKLNRISLEERAGKEAKEPAETGDEHQSQVGS